MTFWTSNWLQVGLCWAIVAFATATVAVAVQKAQLSAELSEVLSKIEELESAPVAQRLLSSVPKADEETIDYRLPTTLIPTHYELYWHPDLESGTFLGQELITLEAKEATKQIVLHSYKLNITSVYLPGNTSVWTAYEVAGYELDEVRQFLIIDLVEEIPLGDEVTLGILFEGPMLDKLVGLYSSSYQTAAGEQKKIATTKFEPTYARQAFPCFDEPALKATFNITVAHPTDYHVLSNMNLQETVFLGENSESIFATSVPMSTYLACIIVSDFDFKSTSVNAEGIGSDFEMNAYATPHQVDKLEFALTFGAAVTEYYIQYYKVAYPLPKLDMAAIPDFASNAMEHWGLVTYRETALLYDKEYSSTSNKQSIAGVLAHEIAHMWFGNLVTMKWWNDIWLNEGFARYMQYKGVNAVHPEWNMMEQFQIIALHSVMIFDAKLSSHPIVQTVESPNEITAIFDTISYEKGGSIIRMLENLVGADTFETAVTNYLEKFQFSNAETDDFLTEVAALVTDYDVKLLMRTWMEQMNYPVLEVTRSSDTGFTITQKRFLSNPSSYSEVSDDSTFNYKWSVPVTYFLDTDASGASNSIIFPYDNDQLGIAVSNEVKWLKLNVHQLGYYRVNYEEDIWKLIIEELTNNLERFDSADRAHLLNDAFALADASQLSYVIPLEMTAYLPQEKEFVPWYVAAQKLRALQKSLMYADTYVSYLTYAQMLLTNPYASVGWSVNTDVDSHLENRLRVSILTAACALGQSDCLAEAAARFQSWLAEPTTKPHPDLREIVYYYGMQQSNSESQWMQLLALFQAEEDASEKLKLMYGLSGVQDPQLLYQLLEMATDESIVRSQDYFTCVGYIAGNPIGEPLVWDYYREHWLELVARFGLSDRYLGRLIATITSNFASEVKLEELQQFFEKYPESGAGASSRVQAQETIKYNIKWLEENSEGIASWLNGTASPL